VRRAGFTLVELMIVVGILGVLAAIAIPNFIRYQMRAKTTEALVNLQAIARSQEAYFAEFGSYVSVSTPNPLAIPGARAVIWPAGSGFDVMGWAPEGSVYFQYGVAADNPNGGSSLLRYTAEAAGDIDEDGNPSFFAYVAPARGQIAGMAGALPGSTCAGSGVFDPGSATRSALRVPGACDAASGRSEF